VEAKKNGGGSRPSGEGDDSDKKRDKRPAQGERQDRLADQGEMPRPGAHEGGGFHAGREGNRRVLKRKGSRTEKMAADERGRARCWPPWKSASPTCGKKVRYLTVAGPGKGTSKGSKRKDEPEREALKKARDPKKCIFMAVAMNKKGGRSKPTGNPVPFP